MTGCFISVTQQDEGKKLRHGAQTHSKGRRRPLDIPFHVSNSAKLLFSSKNKMINDPPVLQSSASWSSSPHLFIASSEQHQVFAFSFSHFRVKRLTGKTVSSVSCDS